MLPKAGLEPLRTCPKSLRTVSEVEPNSLPAGQEGVLDDPKSSAIHLPVIADGIGTQNVMWNFDL